MAKKQKKFFYVIVCDNCKLKFVTDVNTDARSCSWDTSEGKKPYKFHSWNDANYLCMVIACNMRIWAYPVVNSYELEQLPYFERETKDEETKVE